MEYPHIYQSFTIVRHQSSPSGRGFYRIYKDDRFIETASNPKNAKRLIDFIIQHGLPL